MLKIDGSKTTAHGSLSEVSHALQHVGNGTLSNKLNNLELSLQALGIGAPAIFANLTSSPDGLALESLQVFGTLNAMTDAVHQSSQERYMKTPLEALKMERIITHHIKRAGITSVGQLASFTREQIKDLKGIGENTYYAISAAFAKAKISFRDDQDLLTHPKHCDISDLCLYRDYIANIKNAGFLTTEHLAAITLEEFKVTVGWTHSVYRSQIRAIEGELGIRGICFKGEEIIF